MASERAGDVAAGAGLQDPGIPASMPDLEAARHALQRQLDAQLTQAKRNRLGQFATPPALAEDVLRHAVGLLPAQAGIHFLDPAIGTGAFYAALRRVAPTRIRQALGFEIDPHYGLPAAALWQGTGLEYRHGDFTAAAPGPRCNLLICNPPYVRHHHLGSLQKLRMQRRARRASGMQPSGLSGLYCYFIGIAHAWMATGAVAGWLIPGEWMDVNYGRSLKRYLLEKVTLLQVHRFDPREVQFADALVSSSVVWLRKEAPPHDHAVRFTFGGSLARPVKSRTVAAAVLGQEAKWSRFPAAAVRRRTPVATLSELFRIKRGIATGHNRFFILSLEEIRARHLPLETFRPILPGPRHLAQDRIEADARGWPMLERQLFLLDTRLPEHEIRQRHPALFAYLQEGREHRLHDRYLCRHRTPWYAQEQRPAAPILCTYLGRAGAARQRPFRFILNRSSATCANVYLMLYPTAVLAAALQADPTLAERLWQQLQELTANELLAQGRVYGGGLYKLEPTELASVRVPHLMKLPS